MKRITLLPFLICTFFMYSLNFAITANTNNIHTTTASNLCPAPIVTSFSPDNGPESTLITITGSNFTDATSLDFDGTNATFTIINDSEITVNVPSGTASTSAISITSSGGCTGTSSSNFTLLATDCTTAEIYISEIYDASSGDYAVIELYNPTNTPVVIDGTYVILRYGDVGNTTPNNTFDQIIGTIPPLSTFIIQMGSGSNCSPLDVDFNIPTGINDNDEFELLKNNVLIDIVNSPAERGYTVIRNANAPIPQTTYNINDWNILSSENCSDLGSHTADPIPDTTPTITHPTSQTICENGTAVFSTTEDSGTATFQWKILNASGNWINLTNNTTYSGTQTNTLTVNNAPATLDGSQYYCEISATSCTLITDAAQLIIDAPNVDTIANQTVCTEYILPTLTDGNYFTATNGGGTQLTAGTSITTSQTIYIYNEIGTAPDNCDNESSFAITVSGTPDVDTIANQTVCSEYILPTLTDGNYFTATNGGGTQLTAGTAITTSQTIYIYNEIGTAPDNCDNESSFAVTVSGTPDVDTIANQTVCSEYILPTLTDGNYFTATNGGGTQLAVGTAITTSQTIYIYNEVGTAPDNCDNESSFTVTVSGTPDVDTIANQTVCSEYVLPTLTDGNYFTATNGGGTQLTAGTAITTSQTIYIYNEIGTAPDNCDNESSFAVTVSGTPNVDTISNQTVCSEYILPTLTDGNYFTATNGGGTQLTAGTAITTSQTIYIYNEIGTAPNNCDNESSFSVTVSGTPDVDTIANQTVCSEYVLPTLTDGNYFTATNGGGTQLTAGTAITTSQTIYIYNEIGTAPNNCDNESSFAVTVSGTPNVDTIANQTVCSEYVLPTLTDGNYFSATNGGGTQLTAGTAITTSQTIYIYNEIGTAPDNCFNESVFDITIYPATDFTLTSSNITIVEDEITVTMTDTSISYLYSVDSSSSQVSNIFSNLLDGTHMLYVEDANGCVVKSLLFDIVSAPELFIPKFFTPNGDNVKEIWQIIDPLNSIKEVYIFNRYGKLLKQISPNALYWDGTYNGHILESNDYWYVINLHSNKQLTGHFTLKR